MLIHVACLSRRVSRRIGLLLWALGLVDLALSPLWIRYFHLAGHARSISIDFVSGIVIGAGAVLLVYSFGSSEKDEGLPEELSVLDAQSDHGESPGQKS
jgi:hypothetical protein